MYGTMEPQGGDDMKRIYTEIRIHHQTAEDKKRFERQLDNKIKAAGFGSRAEYIKVMTLNSNIGVAANAREDVKMKKEIQKYWEQDFESDPNYYRLRTVEKILGLDGCKVYANVPDDAVYTVIVADEVQIIDLSDADWEDDYDLADLIYDRLE
jgi:hypothetical protein